MSAFTIVLADPSRPAYETAARAVVEPHGWRLLLPETVADADLLAVAREADVLVTRRRVVPLEILEAAARLRSVQHLGSRLDPEVARWAHGAGVPLEVTPTRGTIAVAEQAMALLLALTRRIVAGHQATASGAYRERGLTPAPTSETRIAFQWLDLPGLDLLDGKTLGLLGFGEIGRAVAQRALAFGMVVRYHRRRRLPADEERALGVAYLDRAALFAESDVVSLHLPHTPETERLVDADALARMRHGSYLINVARGGVVDEPALVDALQRGHLAGAGLDVFADEPVPADHPLLALPNVVLSPHVGAAPARGLAEMVEALLPKLRRVAARPLGVRR